MLSVCNSINTNKCKNYYCSLMLVIPHHWLWLIWNPVIQVVTLKLKLEIKHAILLHILPNTSRLRTRPIKMQEAAAARCKIITCSTDEGHKETWLIRFWPRADTDELVQFNFLNDAAGGLMCTSWNFNNIWVGKKKTAAHSLEVDQDVFGRPFLPAQTAPALAHLVVDVVKADSGAIPLVPCTTCLKNSLFTFNHFTLELHWHV